MGGYDVAIRFGAIIVGNFGLYVTQVPFKWTDYRKFVPVAYQRAIRDKQEVKGKGKGNGTAGGTYSPGKMGAANMGRRTRTNHPSTPSRRSQTSSSSFGPASKTPKLVSYWVVVVQSQNSGYDISRLYPFTFSLLLFLSKNGSGPPLLPPPRFTRVPCPVQFARILYLFPPIASSLSVLVHSDVHLYLEM